MLTIKKFFGLAGIFWLLFCVLLPSVGFAQFAQRTHIVGLESKAYAKVNSDGALLVTSDLSSTSSGVLTCFLSSAATTNATSCKAASGNVYAIHVTNDSATKVYLKLYNTASAPTCSSATGVVEILPVAAGDMNGRSLSNGQTFSSGIGFCLTASGAATSNDEATTGVYVTILYK